MRLARLVAIGLWFLALCAGAMQERAPGVKRLVIEIEVDLAKARHVRNGQPFWASAETPDEQLVDIAGRLVQRRFDAMERAARVEREVGTNRFRVSLPSLDERDRELFEGMLKSMGVGEFLFMADETSAKARGIDLAAESAKFDAWRRTNKSAALGAYDALAPDEGGPARGLAWFGTSFGGTVGEPKPVLLPAEATDVIGAASFERTFPTQDAFGYPALGFEIRASRALDFTRLTGSHLNERMAVLLGDWIVSAPNLNTKLSDSGVIEGKLGESEVKSWIEALQKLEGPLHIVEPR